MWPWSEESDEIVGQMRVAFLWIGLTWRPTYLRLVTIDLAIT